MIILILNVCLGACVGVLVASGSYGWAAAIALVNILQGLDHIAERR